MEKPQAVDASAEAEGTGRVPVARLEELEFSSMARRLIELAIELARDEAQSSLLSTPSLLAAMFDPRLSKATGAVQWFLSAVGQGIDRWWKEVRPKYYDRSKSPAAPSVTALTKDPADVFELASRIPLETTKTRQIHSRHLIAALLLHAPSEPTNAHKLLRELGCDPASLRPPLLDSILQWGRDDDEAWRRWLGRGIDSANERPDDAKGPLPSWDLPRVSNH